MDKLSIEDVVNHLGSEGTIAWTTMAQLLVSGSQSCVDGRDKDAVLGTPGGDAGEYLLHLAGIERSTGIQLSAKELGPLLERFMLHFGAFYMHTDRKALDTLAKALGEDADFADLAGDSAKVEALVREPGERADKLLPYLIKPEHVGCGHLRLILQNPDEYAVRRDLAEAFLSTVFRKWWAGADLDYVVLEGGHAEGAVVRISAGKPKHAYTRVPMVAPFDGKTQMFVAHPKATSWMRRQVAQFLCEELTQLENIDPAAFAFEVNGLAARQLVATLTHLADGLPVYDAEIREDGTFKVR